MESIGERIKIIRKNNGMTQEEFAERLKIKRNTVATYEVGKSDPSDSAVSLICTVFNVNELWLRSGEGEPFIKKTQHDEIAEFINKIETDDDKFKLELIAMLSQFKDADWELFKKMVKKLAKLDDPAGTGLEDKSVEELEEIYKKEILSAPSEPGATA